MISTSKRPILEIACFNKQSAAIAANAGADRIELCQDYHLGGLSADTTILKQLKSELAISIPIYTMIRPHANHFYYNVADFTAMKDTLLFLRSQGADGFVFGILNRPQEHHGDATVSWIDVPRNKELVRLADGRPCTFHRAFDSIPESHWETALGDIRECGFASILTNGGPSGTKAMECVDKLQTLINQKERQRDLFDNLQSHKVPEIIVGGGVRASNIGFLYEHTGALAFHSAALLGSDVDASEDEIFKMKQQLS